MAFNYDKGMGLLQGLYAGLQSYGDAVKESKKIEREGLIHRQKQAEEDARLRAEKGLIAKRDASGLISGYDKDPEFVRHQVQEETAKDYRSGVSIPRDPMTGEITGKPDYSGLAARAEASMTPTEKKIKNLQLEKEQRESGGKTIPASDVVAVGGADAAINALSEAQKQIELNQDIVGPVQGRVNQLKAIGELGEGGKRMKGLDAQLKLNAQTIGKYLEGGKLTDMDIDRYKKMLPNANDSTESAAVKTKLLQRLINEKKNADLSALKGAGYNTGTLQTTKPIQSGPLSPQEWLKQKRGQ